MMPSFDAFLAVLVQQAGRVADTRVSAQSQHRSGNDRVCRLAAFWYRFQTLPSIQNQPLARFSAYPPNIGRRRSTVVK